jgi:DNA repair exonuclease SbcCD nuclease subunit
MIGSKAVVTGDVHAHNFSQFSKPCPHYGGTRLKQIVEALRSVFAKAHELDIEEVVIIGDLFHTRGLISVQVLNSVLWELQEAKRSGLRVYIVAGNHDQANKAGTVTSLAPFYDYADVVETARNIGRAYYIPFREDRAYYVEAFKTAAKLKCEVVFAHVGLQGAAIGESDYQPKEELLVEETLCEQFKLVLCGHYHKAQYLAANVAYTGSLIQHNFCDVNVVKGFYSIDLDKSAGNRVANHKTEAPEFIKATIPDKPSLLRFLKGYSPDNYYKLLIDSKISLPDGVFDNAIIDHIRADDVYKPRIKGLDGMRPESVVDKFVEYKAVDNAEAVAKVGKQLLKQAAAAKAD